MRGRRVLEDLARWGRDVEGDWRVVPATAAVGAVFFLLLWGVQARTFGAGDLPARAVAAGLLAFGALWSTFGILAMNGLGRLALAAVVGHVVGFVFLTANLLAAEADAMDASFATVALFGLTALGLLAGIPLEWLARRPRPAR